MDTLRLEALVDGYDFTVGNNYREQQLEGGQPRQVKKFSGAIHTVGVTVALDGQRARQYFWAFWRQNQIKQFNWNLQIDQGEMEDCVCQFANQSVPKETFIGGHVRKVSFTVYVTPIARDPDFDQDVINSFEIENGNIEGIEKIPNEYFPNATGV